MKRFILIGTLSGMIFAVLDGFINANPIAQKLMTCYKPIAKSFINVPAGIAIDLFYGFVMCAVFLLIYHCLPSENPVIKGVLYGLIIWFFRVVMYVFSTYMTLQVPMNTLGYILLSGLIEVLIIGIFYGLTIKPMQ